MDIEYKNYTITEQNGIMTREFLRLVDIPQTTVYQREMEKQLNDKITSQKW